MFPDRSSASFFQTWFPWLQSWHPPQAKVSVAQLGNPILRQKAQPIEDPTAPWVQTLADDLLAQIQTSKGVGIAAPQISQGYRMLVIASHPNDRYPTAPLMEPIVLINPVIVHQASSSVKDWEGCLSVPHMRGLVDRYQWVEVSYSDRQGQPQQQRFEDFVARIFQHEYDHLEGKIFLDRVTQVDDLMTEAEWRSRVLPPAHHSSNG